jgi:hypothetical protein
MRAKLDKQIDSVQCSGSTLMGVGKEGEREKDLPFEQLLNG